MRGELFYGTPFWFWALAFLCAVITLLMLPTTYARPVRNALIDSDAAKIVAPLAGVFGFIVVMSTAYQIMVDLGDRSVEREVRRTEAIERAWQRLLSRAPGNTGKGGALGLLIREEQGLQNIDLSCRAIGDWNSTTDTCDGRPILAGIHVPTISGRRQPVLDGLRLDNTIITQSHIAASTVFRDVKMRNTRISNSELVAVGIQGEIGDLDIETTALLDTWFSQPISLKRIANSNVSGATISGLDQINVLYLSTNYFWADWPPLRETLHKFEGGPEPDSFYGDAVLGVMKICRPPLLNDGRVVRHMERKLRFNTYECELISIQQARKEFPGAYNREEAVKAWEERRFPMESRR